MLTFWKHFGDFVDVPSSSSLVFLPHVQCLLRLGHLAGLKCDPLNLDSLALIKCADQLGPLSLFFVDLSSLLFYQLRNYFFPDFQHQNCWLLIEPDLIHLLQPSPIRRLVGVR